MNATALLIQALDFSARHHADQRRKGRENVPYINHPIRVAYYLATVAEIEDPQLIAAAILHDTVEDTSAGADEIRAEFGEKIAELVGEVTDDKSLAKRVRKQKQIDHAPQVSWAASQLKLADKLSNVEDISQAPPADWSLARRREYIEWTEQVVERLPEPHPELAKAYRAAVERAKAGLAAEAANTADTAHSPDAAEAAHTPDAAEAADAADQTLKGDSS